MCELWFQLFLSPIEEHEQQLPYVPNYIEYQPNIKIWNYSCGKLIHKRFQLNMLHTNGALEASIQLVWQKYFSTQMYKISNSKAI